MATTQLSDVAEAFVKVFQREFPEHKFVFSPVLYDPNDFSPRTVLVVDNRKSPIRMTLGEFDKFSVKAEWELVQVMCDEIERYFRQAGIHYHRRGKYDLARSCCEHRYMHTDDDLKHYIGGKLKAVELKAGPTVDTGEVSETMFMHVKTTKGMFVINTYNEHNGYYGGICITAALNKWE